MGNLLFIAGIPGTGKTHIGDYLRNSHGFEHVDVEHEIMRTRRVPSALLQRPRARHRFRVVTWGFVPGNDDAHVEALLDAGALMVWFEGDREVARTHWRRANPGLAETLFDDQIKRIDEGALPTFGARAIGYDPFGGSPNHRPEDQVASELIEMLEQQD